MDDDLLKTKQMLLSAVAKEGMLTFLGAYPSEDVHEIHWNSELESDPSKFVSLAKSLGAKALYVNWIVFEKNSLDEATIEESDEDEGQDALTTEHNEKVAEFKRYLGKVASVRAGFFLDGIFHVFDTETSWYQEFGELIADVDDEEDVEEDEAALSESALAWAEKLARDPTFGRTKGWGAKKYLLGKLSGQEFSQLPVDAIISRAEDIYEVDVKPIEERRLAEQVREMKERGLSIVAIAGQLDLPRERVQRLLAKTEN